MPQRPGALVTLRRVAGAALAVVAMVVALGAGLAPSASPASPASPAASGAPDYASGPYASRLCGGGSGDLVCVATRTVAAMTQGAEQRTRAQAGGASCELQSGLWVCFGSDSVLAQRGGTTYGDTFLTARDAEPLGPDLLAHEIEHVRQWRLFGPDFALMYLLEGADPCTNYFEVAAGLGAGGYRCA